VTKESKRCNTCEHNVLKPESNLTSIKFKLHQMAIFVVPEIRLVSVPQWRCGETNDVVLSIINRYETDIYVSLAAILDCSLHESTKSMLRMRKTAEIAFSNSAETPFIQIDHQDSSKAQSANKQADYDLGGLVCFRRENKIAIACSVTPNSNAKNVCVALLLKYYADNGQTPTSTTPLINESQASMQNVPISPILAASQGITSPSSLGLGINVGVSGIGTSANPTQQVVFLDLGPVKIEDGLKVIPRPKYIEEFLSSILQSTNVSKSNK
jgi:hypothetical protein